MLTNKFESLEKLIGNTPLIKIRVSYKDRKIDVFAKLEWFNLTGSIKDRAALLMLKKAYLDGSFTSNHTVVEVTSGNMGISLATICASLGVKVNIIMPNHVSMERKAIIKMLGAEVIEQSSFDECFLKCDSYNNTQKYCRTYQFDNILNVKANNKTGDEILEKLPAVEMFVSGVGTGGTLMGVAEMLIKKSTTRTKIVAVDPEESSLLTLGRSKGKHSIQGLSDSKIPSLYKREMVDEIIAISDEDAIEMAKKLNKTGLPVGISGGANFWVVIKSAIKNNISKVVTIFPDDNKKYVSTDLSKPITQPADFIKEIEILDWEVI